MKQILLFLLLCAGLSGYAQTNLPAPFSRLPMRLFGRSPATINGLLVVSGPPVSVTAVTYSNLDKNQVLAGLQPVVVLMGSQFYINWTPTQTAAMANLGSVWLELVIGGTTVLSQTVYFELTNRLIPIEQNTISVNVSTLTPSDLSSAVNGLRVTKVATFTQAQALITPGTPKEFLIVKYAPWNCATRSTFDGAQWSHFPTIITTE